MPAKGTRKSKGKERKKEVSPTSTGTITRSRDKKDSADVAHALALSQKDHLQQQEMQEEEDRTLRLTLRRSLRDVSTAKTPPGYVRDVDGKLFVSSARHVPPPSFLCVSLPPPSAWGILILGPPPSLLSSLPWGISLRIPKHPFPGGEVLEERLSIGVRVCSPNLKAAHCYLPPLLLVQKKMLNQKICLSNPRVIQWRTRMRYLYYLAKS